MLSVGVDLIEIVRVEWAVGRQGQRFFDRIFTPQEQDYCAGRIPSLAGRFAIKEAVAKALGTGIGDVAWTDIETICDENGRPMLKLHNHAAELAEAAGLREWSISISHTDTHAVGFAVAMGIPT